MSLPGGEKPTLQDYETAYARLLDPERATTLPNNREKAWVKLVSPGDNGTILKAGIDLILKAKKRCWFEPGGKEGPVLSKTDLEIVRQKLKADPTLVNQALQR